MRALTLKETIVEYLKRRIITGELPPGQKLNEISLTSELDVSSAPLREAFRILENEYLIRSIPRRGCFVTELSMKDCTEIYEIREMIECKAIDLLKTQRATQLPNALSVAQKTAEHLKGFHPDAEWGIHQNPFPLFHMKLVEATGNSWLTRLYGSLSSTLARYQYLCYRHVPSVLDQTQHEHEQILRFISTGAYGEAKKLLKSHIKTFLVLIGERLR